MAFFSAQDWSWNGGPMNNYPIKAMAYDGVYQDDKLACETKYEAAYMYTNGAIGWDIHKNKMRSLGYYKQPVFNLRLKKELPPLEEGEEWMAIWRWIPAGKALLWCRVRSDITNIDTQRSGFLWIQLALKWPHYKQLNQVDEDFEDWFFAAHEDVMQRAHEKLKKMKDAANKGQ